MPEMRLFCELSRPTRCDTVGGLGPTPAEVWADRSAGAPGSISPYKLDSRGEVESGEEGDRHIRIHVIFPMRTHNMQKAL